jgi:hypothetical protein
MVAGSIPHPPVSLLAAIAHASDATAIKRVVSQATVLVFVGTAALGSLFLSVVAPDVAFADLWFWLLAASCFVGLVLFSLLQLLIGARPRKLVTRSYRTFLQSLRSSGRHGPAASSHNIIEGVFRDPTTGRTVTAPYAAAFDHLVVVLAQVVTLERQLSFRSLDDLETCVVEVEKLRIHLEADLVDGEGVADIVGQEMVTRLEQAEFHAAAMERLLLLERTVTHALAEVDRRIRMVVGKGEGASHPARKEFLAWWAQARSGISNDFRLFVASIGWSR